MSRLTASRYRDLCSFLSDSLDHSRPVIQEAGSTCDWPVAIYLLGHRDPVTNALIVDYVGSARRLTSDVSARIREHLRDPHKSRRFTSQVLLPLRVDTDVRELRRLEGVVARALGTPRWCERVPR